MSYNCEVCGSHSPPRHPRLTHIVYHDTGQISREIEVCRTCHHKLEQGASVDELMLGFRPREVKAEPVKPVNMIERWRKSSIADFQNSRRQKPQ